MQTSILRICQAAMLGLIICSPVVAGAQDQAAGSLAEKSLTKEQMFKTGAKLIKQKATEEGLRWLKNSAKAGYVKAAFELAVLYEGGRLGVGQDYEQANTYYGQAMAQGHRDALFNNALLLSNNKVPFNDLVKARELLQKLAVLDDVEAQFALSNLFNKSNSTTPAQPEEAFQWLQKSADKGYSKAQFMLGGHYLRGEQVKKDVHIALDWFSKSAMQNEPEAHFSLGLLYDRGDGEIKANPARAVEWYESAATLGNTSAMQNLGIKYMLGEQVPADTDKALELITRAANADLVVSQLLLGRLYQSGYEAHLAIDLNKAKQWYLRAAKQGHSDAQYRLARLLLKSKESEKDGKYWVGQAAAAGHKEAQALETGI